MYLFHFFPPIWLIFHEKTIFWKGRKFEKTNVKWNAKKFPQITMIHDFSQSKGPSLTKKSFYCSSSFLKGFFIAKNLNVALLDTLGLFFVGCFSKTIFIGPFTSIFFYDYNMICILMFFQYYYSMFFIICYKSFHFVCVWVRNMHKTNISWLKGFQHQPFSHHSHKKNQTNCIVIMT